MSNIAHNILLLHLTCHIVIFLFQQIRHALAYLIVTLVFLNPHLFLYLGVLQIEAVTRRILWVKANDHRAKVLVFSSWNDVLDVLEHAFAANNITFFRMKGGRYDNLCRYYFSICLCIYTGLLDIHLEKEKKKILENKQKKK